MREEIPKQLPKKRTISTRMPMGTKRPKTGRACLACRKLKARCESGATESNSCNLFEFKACHRCKTLRIDCLYEDSIGLVVKAKEESSSASSLVVPHKLVKRSERERSRTYDDRKTLELPKKSLEVYHTELPQSGQVKADPGESDTRASVELVPHLNSSDPELSIDDVGALFENVDAGQFTQHEAYDFLPTNQVLAPAYGSFQHHPCCPLAPLFTSSIELPNVFDFGYLSSPPTHESTAVPEAESQTAPHTMSTLWSAFEWKPTLH